MRTATITVADDASAELTVDGLSSPYPDVGAAVAAAKEAAVAAGETLTVEIVDSGTGHTLLIDADGTVRSAGPQLEPAAGEENAPGPATAPHDAADEHAALPVDGSPDTTIAPPHPAEAGSGEQADPPEPASAAETAQPAATADRYSGPAPARGKTGRPTRARRRAAVLDAASKPFGGISAPTAVLAVLLILTVAVFLIPDVIGSPDEQPAQQESTSASNAAHLDVSDSTTPVPGFAEEPAWQTAVAPTASVTATGRGVLVVDGADVSVLDPTTGQTRWAGTAEPSLDFAADTLIDGRRALVWRHGDSAGALFDGETEPVEYPLPADARLSAAGSSVLVKSGDSLYGFTADGLSELPTPAAGSTPMGLDESTLISSDFDGPLVLTDVSSGEAVEVPLESPGEGKSIVGWKTAGHGLAVTAWGSSPDDSELTLAVHTIDEGALVSVNDVTADEIRDAEWTRGQGFRLATIGPLVYSMEDGIVLDDGRRTGVDYHAPRGELIPATAGDRSIIVSGEQAFATPADLLAVTDDQRFAIVRASADRVAAYQQR